MNTMIAVDAARLDRLEDEIRQLRESLKGATVKPRSEWVRIEDAAEEMGCSEATIRRKIRTGELEAKGAGKTRRVRL